MALYDQFRQELLNKIKKIDNAKTELNIAIENRKNYESIRGIHFE
ncbi:hypothetical protein [Xenorhabdus doucetiae]